MMKRIFCFLMLLLVPATVFASSLDCWKDEIMYFVLLDRFHNGDKSNDHEVDPGDPFAFHGGDVRGLRVKLDYLQRLGVTGLWISPVFKNREARFFKHAAYHGYWPWDFWQPDLRFADENELRLLRKDTRKRNMKLLLDMVVNHMGYDAPFAKANPEWFNHNGNINDWNSKQQLLNNDIYGLPDFASNSPVVKRFFKLVGRHWLTLMEPDGFRLDAVKHVPAEFWRNFNNEMRKVAGDNFMLLGEYLDGDPKTVLKSWQQGKFTSLFDFPLYYTIREVFAENGDCRKIAARLYFDRNYPNAGLLATFIDNHDLDRFLTLCNGNVNRYLAALTFILTARGIPTLYYGDEQGMTGHESPVPENRRDMVFQTESEIFKYTQSLIKLRKQNEPLRRGLQCHLFADSSAFAFARLSPDALAIAVFNLDEKPREIEFALPFSLQEKILADKINGYKALLRQGRLQVFLPANQAAVFIPKAEAETFVNEFAHWQRRQVNENAWGSKKVVFKLKFDYAPKEAMIYVTGNCDELGNWNSEKGALLLKRISDDEFAAELDLPLGKIIEAKCFYKTINEDESETVTWQDSENQIFAVKDEGSEYIHFNWRTMPLN